MRKMEIMERTDLDVHPLIAHRYSPRSFTAREVTDGELEIVMEAARLAPSCMNEQPWRFLVTRNGEQGHDKLLSTLLPGNRIWADRAPVLILNMTSTNFMKDGRPNDHARHDLGLAIAQLTIQAMALGMGVHQLGGFMPEKARELFEIPEELEAVSVIAMGFPGDAEQLNEPFRTRELARSSRRPLNELVWHGKLPG